MFDEQFEKILGAFLDPINLIVVFVIFLVFVVGLFFFVKEKNCAVFPSLLTTIGVFGTFLGIFLGLLNFDVTNIDESVTNLLEGLKTAFLSSIEGMFAAVLFRVILLFRQGKNPTEVLSESIADANSSSIRDALEKFIKDLNEGLTAQLGENFKQLNESIGKMVEWLDIHKEFMEKTTGIIENARDALQSSAESLQKVEQAAVPLADNIDHLGQVIKTADEQIQTLKTTLTDIGGLGEQAKTVFPALQEGINEMTTQMNTALTQAMQNVQESITKTSESMEENINTLKTKLSETTQDVADAAKETQNKIEGNFTAFDQQSTEVMSRALQELGNQLTSISSKLANDYDGLATGVERLNALLAKLEANKS